MASSRMSAMMLAIRLTMLSVGAFGMLFSQRARADGFNDMARTLVEIQESPPAITFSWNIPTPSTGTLARRALPSTSNPAHASWTVLKTIPIGATLVTDYTAVPGVAYEYRVFMASNTRMMYAASGINLPLEEYRGKVLLIVDTTQAAACAAELDVLYRDLVGDGWRVVRLDVPRDDGNYATRLQAASVKSSILTEYNKDPGNVKAVLLFGRVPVPYSGYTNPDGHYTRALPADGYYGDINGTWTDSQNYTTLAVDRGDNKKNDGKFDQHQWPSSIDLMVGRIDMYDMPAFGATETVLLKRYIGKDHAWRHKRFQVGSSSMVNSTRGWNWGPYNTARMLSYDLYTFNNSSLWLMRSGLYPTTGGEFSKLIRRRSHLFAYTGNTGGGDVAGSVSTWDMAAGNVLAVYMLEGGSYSVDWDQGNALMRSFPAAMGYSLCGGWSEWPGWYLHHGAAGGPLGLSARIMQNATPSDYYEDFSDGRYIHMALQGDPTVRMYYVAPPGDLAATLDSGNVRLDWTASTDQDVVGYHIYRAASITNVFSRLNSAVPVAATTYTDSAARSGSVLYMVRAVRLERSPTATFWNMSQGVFVPFRADNSSNGRPVADPQTLQANEGTPLSITLTGSDAEGDALTCVLGEMTTNGALSGEPPNLVYTPYNNAFGTDRLTFTVHDAYGPSTPAAVDIAIGPLAGRIVTSLDNEPINFPTPEGGTVDFQVKLAAEPAADTVVTVAQSGDADITVQEGANLTFTPADWDQWQTVTLAAAPDDDTDMSFATITCSASGLTSRVLTTYENERDGGMPISAGTGGTVSPNGTVAVVNGAAVRITATPSTGYAFDHWGRAGWPWEYGASEFVNMYASNTIINGGNIIQATFRVATNVVAVPDAAVVGMPRGGTTTFQVKLSAQPNSNVTLTVARTDGATNVMVQSGGSLVFTTNDWNTYKLVTVAADSNAVAGAQAVINCSVSSSDARAVMATVLAEGETRTLYYMGGDHGDISGPNPQAVPYGGDGEEVTAVPHPGYGFTSWSDGSTANPRRDTNIRCYLGFRANYAPSIVTCAIVEPASGLVIRNGSNVTITATATSSLATVSKMDFYQDGVWMGEDLSAPFQFTWLNVPLGNYAFTAKATDSVGATGESAPVYVAATADGLPGRVAATGGTVTNYTENGTNYTAHIFSTTGSETLTVTSGGFMSVLVVGGGGGGGSNGGGGGGAGGVIYHNAFLAVEADYAVTVGAGGAPHPNTSVAIVNGGDSCFGSLIAMGGGGGSSRDNGSTAAASGGSGGGGAGTWDGNRVTAGTCLAPGQGNSGGRGIMDAEVSGGGVNAAGGGGGGAGGAGTAGAYQQGGNGGGGFQCAALSSLGGSPAGWFGGGGGGGRVVNGNNGLGGNGGGGNANVPGVANTGGGGGAGGGNGGAGAQSGGSGIVIVRYLGSNRAPTANAQSVITTEGTAKAITLTGSDPEGSNLTYSVVTSPAHGTLSGIPPNVTYTPTTSYNGADSFTFRVNDEELYSGAATVAITVNFGGQVQATGGVVTNYTENDTDFTAHIFTDTMGPTSFVVSARGCIEYLVVGGGGGGGRQHGGGGGAGGLLTGTINVTAGSSFTIIVGQGGAGAVVNGPGARGNDSVFGALTAFGGGGGRSWTHTDNDGDGGSGGGGYGGGGGGGAGTSGQGSNGGNGSGSTSSGGGGGGAGSAGANATADGGAGGNGVTSSFASGVAVWYAGGGGGGGDSGCLGGVGGSGGGGHGGDNWGQTSLTAGTDGFGGGGGGTRGDVNAARGGSGIVIVRYVTGGELSAYEQWRRVHFTSEQLENIGVDTADPDGDGMNNLNEFYAGTIPTNRISVLCLNDYESRMADGGFVIRWQSVSNHWYTVQAATSLLSGFNLNLRTNIFATPPENVHTDSVIGAGMRFYRLKLETGN